jgi:predicted nucleic acid-binding protein
MHQRYPLVPDLAKTFRKGKLDVGLADASIVVLAEKHATVDVLTFDARHFRAMHGPAGRPFRLLPDDFPM